MSRRVLALCAAVIGLAATPVLAAAPPAPACPPNPPLPAPSRTPRCAFSDSSLAYAGTPRQQALCLMPAGDSGRYVTRQTLGAPLDGLVGAPVSIDRKRLLQLLKANGVAYPPGSLATGVSGVWNGRRFLAAARYFVIHDTSSPAFKAPFPSDSAPSVNRLGYQYCGGAFTAHAFVNRLGEVFLAYDFSAPWRATKFEMSNPDRKGLFLHVELNQPRRPRRGESLDNASLTPDPPFTDEQYRALALLYVTASVRAGHWLAPAFHSAIDSAWDDDHDDPRGFELAKFDAALARLLRQVGA